MSATDSRPPWARHRYQGLCPDTIEGWAARDPDCAACAWLDRAQRLMGDNDGTLPGVTRPGKWAVPDRWLPMDGEVVLARWRDEPLLCWRDVDEWFLPGGQRHEALTDAGGPDLWSPLPTVPDDDCDEPVPTTADPAIAPPDDDCESPWSVS